MILFLIRDPLLHVLGAEGEVMKQAGWYIKIIIAGSVLQVCGTGITPLLRNMNKAFAAMLSMAIGFVTNIGVNYYLMFPMKMGIRGAAYGTVTAQFVVLLCSILFIMGSYREKVRPALKKRLAAGIKNCLHFR